MPAVTFGSLRPGDCFRFYDNWTRRRHSPFPPGVLRRGADRFQITSTDPRIDARHIYPIDDLRVLKVRCPDEAAPARRARRRVDVCQDTTLAHLVEESGRQLFLDYDPSQLEALAKAAGADWSWKTTNAVQRAYKDHLGYLRQRLYAFSEDEIVEVIPEPRTEKERIYAVREIPRGATQASPGSRFYKRPHPLRRQHVRDHEARARRAGCETMIKWAKHCRQPDPPPWVKVCAETKFPYNPKRYKGLTRREANIQRYAYDNRPRRQIPVL